MTDSQALDDTINKAAFRSAVVLILAGVLSVFFPLDAPAGPFAERMIWFSANVGAFTMGWLVQMIAMLTLAGVFACTAWQVRKSHPVRTFVSGTALLISVVAFIIPKFMAIWSIQQMVVASSIFGLLVAWPLFRLTLSAKIAAVGLGLFGLLFHLLFVGVMMGSVASADIGPYAESMGILLLIPVISMAFFFRAQLKEASNA
jgi:hypothetical protein